MYNLMCFLCLLLAMLVAPCMALAESPEPWDERYWNPKPMDGDVVLPLPCGGRMAFRKVTLRSTGWLDDMRIEVGHNDPAVGWKEERHFEYLAGAFTELGNAGQRSFLVAKYETTVSQWQALSEICPKMSMRGRLPITGVSWFDAVDFSRRYNEWLLAEASGTLPQEGEATGFLRLPTEAEWEFAARGGLAVDAADFVAKLFPMPGGETAEYVWFQGSGSAAGKLQPVGLLNSNPLGLFDIVGNASEMVLEPFRLNRRGRLHGQPGGFIAKGGDITVPLNQLRTGVRFEHSYFSTLTGTATSLRHLGFRLIVAAPVVVSDGRLTEIQAEWQRLPAPDPSLATSRQENEALATLGDVTRRVPNPEMRGSLAQVTRDLEQAIAERNQARDRALRALLRTGAFFAHKLRTDHVRLVSIESAIENVAEPALEQLRDRVEDLPHGSGLIADAEQEVEEMKQQRDNLEAQRGVALSYYADLVIMVANDFIQDSINTQINALDEEFKAKNSKFFSKYLQIHARHVDEYRHNGAADKNRWIYDFVQ